MDLNYLGCTHTVHRTEVTRTGFSSGVRELGNERASSLKAHNFWHGHSKLSRSKFSDLYSVWVKARRQRLRIGR
jgi:hypothetical protein